MYTKLYWPGQDVNKYTHYYIWYHIAPLRASRKIYNNRKEAVETKNASGNIVLYHTSKYQVPGRIFVFSSTPGDHEKSYHNYVLMPPSATLPIRTEAGQYTDNDILASRVFLTHRRASSSALYI